MLLTSGCHHQFRTVAFGPLLQLFTGRVEGQSAGSMSLPSVFSSISAMTALCILIRAAVLPVALWLLPNDGTVGQ